jgi:GWxTD domain-containing protein
MMKFRPILAAAIVLAVLAPLPAIGGQAPKGLPERFRQWVDEEVVYIITAKERDVFFDLQTDRERDIFIEAFWKQRDPTPGTPRNEFREEHYSRLKYANDVYGRSASVPGWKTDRGRTYIVLGPPKTIESFSNVQNVYPIEIWSYLGDPAVGLPTAFNVIFFKRNGIGDYIFYSPSQDGPESLLADAFISGEDPNKAYQTLRKYEPNLAYQTLSLIPGERLMPGSVSLASTRLMADIFSSPQKRVQDDYAAAILKYKDFVDVDYTANYIGSDAGLQVIRDDAGGFFIHYDVEPGKITVEEAGGKYEARFEITGRVSDAGGRTIYQFDKEFPFSLTAEELKSVRVHTISLQDVFPLVPGTYNFDLLLKNPASKEFASSERKVVVPADPSALAMSPLLLAYGVEKSPGPPAERIPFKAGDVQILCQARKSYGATDTLVLFFQIYGLSDELRSGGALRFAFLKEDKPFSEREKKLSEYGRGQNFLERQDLADFTPGYYQVRVILVDAQGQERLSAKENFEVTTLPSYPRPMVISKVATAGGAEADLFATGLQCLNKGDLAEARVRLEGAYRRSPQRLEYAVGFAEVLFRQGDFRRAKEVLLPFAADEQAPADLLSLLGRSCHALSEYGDAVTYYTAYLARFGTNIDILNFLGTCYFQLGRREEAVKAWEKSLEVAPNQDKIKNLLDSLKKK